MYKKLFFLALSLISFNLFAQETNVPKPEFEELPYVWLKETNEIKPLAKETADAKMGLKVSYKFSGPSSSAKVPADKKVSFLLSSTMSGAAALAPFKLYKLEQDKKSRKVAIVSMGIGKANNRDESLIDFNMKKVGDNLYEYVLSAPLEKGEYVFTNSMTYFTFSVE